MITNSYSMEIKLKERKWKFQTTLPVQPPFESRAFILKKNMLLFQDS